ncbi:MULTISPECIES: hypothetical protein [Pseudomonadaceae]|jgi:hypothetical protein|uniref:hypothetical protein n=1 Tax=Pseudomonadaceae TaxID=135621 RepID=UPI00077336CD|nr:MULTISPECIES: hypothetical protein [Pseudomonas]KXK70111.1 hypothetical protein BC89_15515 [Pseudomonas monteilii]MCO7620661.1 hypothetical protein [Pseudomonas guariconensis]MCU9531423.1 hypothetical protein [Pseudomonas mosselii]MCU9537682.1 hypothetical protein [Pseudomonas mosselii]MCU9544605.1 hypothetical protein [Pseudomonas mosselii]
MNETQVEKIATQYGINQPDAGRLLSEASKLCAIADNQGEVDLNDAWLVNQVGMQETQKSWEEHHQVNVEQAPYWLVMLDTTPIPIVGPLDSDLIDILVGRVLV